MTVRGALEHLHVLLLGNMQERRNTLYLVSMLCRGFDLSGASAESLGLSKDRAERYGNSGGPELDVVLKTLPISPADAALDIGCGKGGAMLTMAKYPFSRVDGVEISPELAKIAVRHLARAKIANASVFCCDATEFQDFDPYTFLYMFHPFPEIVLRDVLDNLFQSLTRRPRKLTLVYYNPACHDALIRAGFSKTGEFNHGRLQFCTYTIGG